MRVLYKSPEKSLFDDILDIITNAIEDNQRDYENELIPDKPVTLKSYDPKKVFFVPGVEKVLFRDPATIVWFSDGTKSVAICGYDDVYDKETGVAICLCKRMLGNKEYRELMDKWCYDKKENLS